MASYSLEQDVCKAELGMSQIARVLRSCKVLIFWIIGIGVVDLEGDKVLGTQLRSGPVVQSYEIRLA